MKYAWESLSWFPQGGLALVLKSEQSLPEMDEFSPLGITDHQQVWLIVRIPMDVETLHLPMDALVQFMLKLTASPLLPDMDWRQREQICTALISLVSSVRNSSSTQASGAYSIRRTTD